MEEVVIGSSMALVMGEVVIGNSKA